MHRIDVAFITNENESGSKSKWRKQCKAEWIQAPKADAADVASAAQFLADAAHATDTAEAVVMRKAVANV